MRIRMHRAGLSRRTVVVASLRFAWVTLLLATPGCGEMALRQKERQMELVARDWAMTIRASQVVPVYPLSQDVQPGDVFLVNQTVAEQSRRFRERGFMPTDLCVARLIPEGYAGFYSARQRAGAAASDGTSPLVLPGDWRDAPEPSVPWERFARAGFPSYTFRVSNASGLSIAVPVQAVPVALSVTGASKATGSVTIADAVTYGIDAPSLYEQLVAARLDGRLDNAIPPEGSGPWYLRVVTRIFAAKSFSVVLTADSTLGGGVDAGGARIVPDSGGALDDGQSVMEINEQLRAIGDPVRPGGPTLPGGSLRATFASGRTIGFEETFVEPLVVGYHGFDVAIDSSGNLGPIIPTFQVLDEQALPLAPMAVTEDDSAYMALIGLLRDGPAERAEAALWKTRRGGHKSPWGISLCPPPSLLRCNDASPATRRRSTNQYDGVRTSTVAGPSLGGRRAKTVPWSTPHQSRLTKGLST